MFIMMTSTIVGMTNWWKHWFTSGTSSPLSIMDLILAANSVSLLTSSRNRSPLDRCVKPYFRTIRSHCVPFPLPGPPAVLQTHVTTLHYYIKNSLPQSTKQLCCCLAVYSPNSTWLVTLRLNTTRHVRRVERVETSVSSRAVRQVRHSHNEWARHDRRAVSCRDVTWRAKWNFGL